MPPPNTSPLPPKDSFETTPGTSTSTNFTKREGVENEGRTWVSTNRFWASRHTLVRPQVRTRSHTNTRSVRDRTDKHMYAHLLTLVHTFTRTNVHGDPYVRFGTHRVLVHSYLDVHTSTRIL